MNQLDAFAAPGATETVNKRAAVHRLFVSTRTVEWAPEPEFSKAEDT